MTYVDMPLHELNMYTGSSPLPEDFDAYWDTTLEATREVDADVFIAPAEFTAPNVDCFDLYYTGLGGARIYAKLLKPKQITGQCPAIVEFHGYTGSSGDWATKLAYAANGFIVASMDCRGQGGKSEDKGGVCGNTLNGHIIRGLVDGAESLLYRYIFSDAAQLAQIVMAMDDVDETKVASMGASQGGALSLACAALEPRIKAAISVHPFLSDYKRVMEMDLPSNAYHELKSFFRRFDPTRSKEDEYFRRLGYIDVQNLAPRIQANVCLFASLLDEVCPASTQFAAYNKISSPKEIVIYPDFDHEGLPGMQDKAFEFICEKLLK
jgi:cephalosporin-C deacetylase